MSKTINLIRGNLLNIGKTYFTILMRSYFDFTKQKLVIFDGDLNKILQLDNVSKINFKPSNITSSYSNLVDSILDAESDCLVNLPSSSSGSILNSKTKKKEFIGIDCWLHEYNYECSKVLMENNINFIHWFVSDGSLESFNSFKFVARTYGKNHKIVLVKNLGIKNYWGKKDEDYIIKDNQITEIPWEYEGKPTSSDIKFKEFAIANCWDYVEFYLPILCYAIADIVDKNPTLSLYDMIINSNIPLFRQNKIIDYFVKTYPQFNKIIGGDLPFFPVNRKNFFDYSDRKIV